MNLTKLKQHKSFSGYTCVYQHDSKMTKTPMKFSVFSPQETVQHCTIWLSGLSCNEENFITKAGAQQYLANTDTMLVCPDTSPRGLNLPHEHDDYDFGSGAGFYVNATTEHYRNHYRMYDYISKELIELITKNFNIKTFSIMGHSMGGHGALMLGLREKDLFKTVSAFAPIVNPSECPWGQKAFTGYLGKNRELWQAYDATELLRQGYQHDKAILIDQGTADEFLESQLLTDNLQQAAGKVGQQLTLRYQDNYDHSYYFIASFIRDHIEFHLRHRL